MMLDYIILMLERGLIALLAIIIYIYLVCSVFPWMTMRLLWRKKAISTRGLQRVSFPEGRGVIYEPDLQVRRYIPRYALVMHGDSKFLQCQVDPRIAYMRYDIVSFDRTGRLLDIVKVSERLETDGTTRRVLLPTDTSHAYIVLRRVDGMYKSRKFVARYSYVGVAIYCALTILTTMLLGWFLYLGVGTVWLVLLPSIAPISGLTVLIKAFFWGVVLCAWTVLRYALRTIKVVNK